MGINKRRIYLVNPAFQLRFSIFVCLIVFISSLIYPLVIYDVLTEIIERNAQVSPDIAARLPKTRQELLIILSLWQLGFTGMIFVICIFFSHKIAGPLYKLMKFFRAVRAGESPGRLFFRKGDYFNEVADEFNLTFEQIQENYKKDLVYLSEVNTYLANLSMVVPDDKKVVLNEINRKLTEIQERFNSI
ncbi:MAG: hypothetical protein A2X86_04835 [Bdellovibrionales bacterium GWA2_49_15]|nr:MAG: hypothetical protein A2X86_04835 [Bdellovibrionales bacterium GWA2_49_15]